MAIPPKYHSIPTSKLHNLSSPIQQTLTLTPYSIPQHSPTSIKTLIQSLLNPNPTPLNLLLYLTAIAAADSTESPTLYWIPKSLSAEANNTIRQLAAAAGYAAVNDLVVELTMEAVPILKGIVKESCVDTEDESVEVKKPVGYAVIAAHQLRWIVSQVGYPDLGKLCQVVIPCALTAMDHWSPEVKEQGMLSFMHLVRNVTAAELSWYEDAILDACQRNVASDDELWRHVIELSVLVLTCTQQKNPRSSWFESLLNEMLSHLDRQPTNKERRIAWLELIEPVLDVMGIFILAHFRRMFYLMFLWLHADDDKTLILVLERLDTIIKVTWMRKSPYFDRLIGELSLLYKEATVRKKCQVIRSHILQLLILLQKCKGLQFEAAWDKQKNDPALSILISSLDKESNLESDLAGNC